MKQLLDNIAIIYNRKKNIEKLNQKFICKSAIHESKNNDKPVSLCILCGEPRCSIDMPVHLEQKHLAINIDNFTFQLVEKYINVSQYNVVKIKNIEFDIDFHVYQSNSEGGIYRLCTYDHIHKILYKGTNYVTTTFVHMTLQLFIHKKYDNIKVASNDPKVGIQEVCYNVDSKCGECGEFDTYRKYIEKDERVDQNKFFEIFRLCECGNCFKHTHLFFNNILEIHDNTVNKEKFIKKYGNINHSSLRNTLMNFITNNIKFYKNYIKDFDKIEVKDLIKNKIQLVKLKDDDKAQIFKNYLETIGLFFEKISIHKETKYIGSYKFIPKKDNYIELAFDIYLIKLSFSPAEEYIFICAKYNYNNKLYERYNGDYKIVLNIIPVYSVINRLGLYSKYVNAGIYICKIFEYSDQIKTLVTDVYENKDIKLPKNINIGRQLSLSSQYLFIGDLYTNMFPLNLLK